MCRCETPPLTSFRFAVTGCATSDCTRVVAVRVAAAADAATVERLLAAVVLLLMPVLPTAEVEAKGVLEIAIAATGKSVWLAAG